MAKGSGPRRDNGKYEGFSGEWDREVFVFASMDERDRFQVATYGHVRNGWREPDEPVDERPPIARGACRCPGCREYGGDFWRDRTEQMNYENAVEASPIQETEYKLAYIAKISAEVEGKYGRPKSMPRPRRGRI